MRKYDIYLADLNPVKGSVQAGVRPCILVQNSLISEHSPTIIVVPLTKNTQRVYQEEFLIEPTQGNGLTVTSKFLGGHIMVLDRKFLQKPLGVLDSHYFPMVKKALSIALDWGDDFLE